MRPTTVLVEGESDRLALETLGRRSGLDLAAMHVAVVAMGGATNLGRCLAHLGSGIRVLGLCDEAEAPAVLRTLDRAGVGAGPITERGFEVCRADLEDELVRALGTDAVLAVIAAQGELASFRLLQRQPALRGRPLGTQLRRFFAGRSGHKITYARLLAEAVPLADTPPPLATLIAWIRRGSDG